MKIIKYISAIIFFAAVSIYADTGGNTYYNSINISCENVSPGELTA